MDSENQISLDINSADADALTQLQGVGARLAERIIAARPFESVADLTRVRGISENDVERLRSFLSISDAAEQPDATEDEVNEKVIENAPANLTEETVSEVEATIDEAEVRTLENIAEIKAEPEDAASDESDTVIEEIEEELDDVEETFTADEDVELVELEGDGEIESVPEELEPIAEPTSELPTSQPESMTRGGVCGLIFVGGLATLILAVAITLGILASVNNGQLSYASPYQIAALRTQTESLSVQADTLAEDIAGLRTRIDNLDALSGRVGDVEIEVDSMQDDVAGLEANVASMQTQYDELATQIVSLDEQIETLTVQGNRFEGFLEGLHALMEGLFPDDAPAVEQTPEVEETP